MSNGQKFYGKYRGTVMNNLDPLQIGRLQVDVPDVAGLIPSSWAMPCFPFTGKQMGAYMIPQIGSGIWVEFEQGNPDYPIWSGCWYGLAAEVRRAPRAVRGDNHPTARDRVFSKFRQFVNASRE